MSSVITTPHTVPTGPPSSVRLESAIRDTLAAWMPAARFLVTFTQLIGLAAIIELFEIESVAFLHLFLLSIAGFVVHESLPARRRLSFFACLSMTGILLVLGASTGAWVLALGLALLGICHIPVSERVRIALLLGGAVVLSTLRGTGATVPWSAAVWPILGSMFMFRLIVYVYDLRHGVAQPNLSRALSYFFVLPNVCFPLFPVIDYKTFVRTYRDTATFETHQVGVRWMIRGLIQLLVYRLIYHYCAISPADITSPADLGRFLVANYLLYLRISGQFHMIVGLLHLFGFDLPETHHRYLLASSLTDFWRRINIYWKDFMMKLFYYPSFFWLKRRGYGPIQSLIAATIFVFLSTWLLHSYQWFWLQGTFPIRWQDGAFWGILGALVVLNSVYEMRHVRARRVSGRWSLFDLTLKTIRTVATFCFICILWSLWTAASISEWVSIWTNAFQIDNRALEVLGIVGGVHALGSIVVPIPQDTGKRVTRWGSYFRPALITTMMIAAVYSCGRPQVYRHLGDLAADIVPSLKERRLNVQDETMLERGYYENLLGVERFNSQLWEHYAKRPAAEWRNLRAAGATRPVDGFLLEELIPSHEVPFRGLPFRTNRWGMHDRDYTREKPPSVYRLAIVGRSDTMGTGIMPEKTFEAVLEKRLNEVYGSPRRQFEIVNFAVAAYSPLQQLWLIENRVFSFQPDAVIFVSHHDDERRSAAHLAKVVRSGVDPSYPFLREIVAKAGVHGRMTEPQIARRLSKFDGDIGNWLHRRMASEIRERGITPIWMFLPFLVEKPSVPDRKVLETVQTSGFVALDFRDIYQAHDPVALRVAEWDHHHPDATGHSIIGEALFRALADGEVVPVLSNEF